MPVPLSYRISLWLPVLLWAGLIWYFSDQPKMTVEETFGVWVDFILRKIAHFTEYFVLAALLWRASRRSFDFSRKGHATFSLAASFFYAVSDEFHQTLVPGFREGSFRDVVIDFAGVWVAVSLLYRLSLPRRS